MSRYAHVTSTLGVEKQSVISSARVLVVGAGGIGCEVLKNLVLAGFEYIEVIDLDTIDVSNLNRQFLFRPEHVGKSKADVAAAAVRAFNPTSNVIAHHGNIKESRFGVSYFKTFSIVLNALDNVDARRHVNRLCLAADVFLIDSGTTGYNGQIMPIKKGVSACYECNPKPTQKVYPICTIRSTPDKPVHCIVWAKEFFKLLFGTPSESMLFEDPSCEEKSLYMHLVPQPAATAGILDFVQQGCALLSAIFDEEIRNKLAMDVYKTAKCVPRPLQYDIFQTAAELVNQIKSGESIRPSKRTGWDQTKWSDVECAAEILLSLIEVYREGDPSVHGKLSFDKDDVHSMRFVCAAANLRARVFGIEVQSYHDCKGVAGNIIPAIATTNAIIAGIQVLSALKCLTAKSDEEKAIAKCCPHTYCMRLSNRRGNYLNPTVPDPPSVGCYVCGRSQLVLEIDSTVATLAILVTKVIKGRLGFNEPSIVINDSIIYEEGEDAGDSMTENLHLVLASCPAGGIRDGSILSITDFSQDLDVTVLVKHVEDSSFNDEENSEHFSIIGVGPSSSSSSFSITSSIAPTTSGSSPVIMKRQRDDEEGDSSGASTKRPTVSVSSSLDEGVNDSNNVV